MLDIIVMDYLERFFKICAEAELSEEQTDLLRDITDPLYTKDRECNLKDVQEITSKLVKHKQYEKLSELIQEKWTYIKFEPNAYKDLADDVLCG